ncbi:hypothetical protein Tco_0970993 [Tanacetum coccineum]
MVIRNSLVYGESEGVRVECVVYESKDRRSKETKDQSDESHIIPIKELRLDDKLKFMEEPVEVMDREIKQLRKSRIPIVKVRWNSKRGLKFTWERKDEIRAKYPHLFSSISSKSN